MINYWVKIRVYMVLTVLMSISSLSSAKTTTFVYKTGGKELLFTGDFYVYYSVTDPKMALRPSGIKNVQYNVITWESKNLKKQIQRVARKDEQQGDGFDDQILEGSVKQRTADLFALDNKMLMQPSQVKGKKEGVEFQYIKNEYFELQATIKNTSEFGFPELSFVLTPKSKGYFSVVYVGAPTADVTEVDEVWQPLIWQEKRFPDKSYITAAFQCPIPTTFVQTKGLTFGVVAHPSEFDFDPLPLLTNSRFAVALHNDRGEASPMMIAPVFGGSGSLMEVDKSFSFRALLYGSKLEVTGAYEEVARTIYGFKDYRRNDICSLNDAFQNIVDYTLSKYSWFIDEEKGCAYATDVPGAVKNVSSLNPLGLAIVTDRREMFEKRAYPIIEYMLSREKFLFCADSTQKIQSPSRRMAGPIAPISELSSLYNITSKGMPFLLQLSQDEYNNKRIRNLEVKEMGQTWQNALWIFKATGDEEWLKRSVRGADVYLATRVNQKAEDFNDPQGGGFFFWTGYTPKWIDLLELYEVTKVEKYLIAARDGARHYTMFTWMSPAIPDDSIVVNKNGKAPMYAYLKKKGHHQMYVSEEKAPAWRLSEIGLTPESSGTSSGHRGIFMANYAAWMLRIAGYTNDTFLRDVAKAAIIGRYRNFPGYHINTARTTIYEKEDYPLRAHKDLSVNSFHYNHIMPMASLLLDYMVTDAWFRSNHAIDFPSEFIEGYAYLQSKFYGHAAGVFYDEKATLWMPADLLTSGSVDLNYISARNDNKLMIAFTNQSDKAIATTIHLNVDKVQLLPNIKYHMRVIADNKTITTGTMVNGNFDIQVSGNGITAIIIKGVALNVDFQDQVLAKAKVWKQDVYVSEDGSVKAMIINVGELTTTAYVYLTKDDKYITSAKLISDNIVVEDNVYPYEFTVPIGRDATEFTAELMITDHNGMSMSIGKVMLKK